MNAKLYVNGTILTMCTPLYANALLIRDGKIIEAGEREVLQKLAPEAEIVDLDGKTLMPAFIDPHSHFSACANAFLQCSVEQAQDTEQLVQLIRDYIAQNQIQPGEWVVARDFDPESLDEKKVPDRSVIDQASPENPLVLQHKSGHVGVLNTAALELLGITADTPDPEGGRMERENGRLTGYFEENAFIQVLHKLPSPTMERLMEAYEKAQKQYASYGIATVQEGMMTAEMIPIYRQLCEQKRLWLDIAAYSSVEDGARIFGAFPKSDGQYDHHFKLGGYKIFLDGSPQSRTAWMKTPYKNSDSCGYPVMKDEVVLEAVKTAVDTKRQILAHCNGDAAAEQYLWALETLNEQGKSPVPVRPVMIHAQFVERDQLKRFAPLGLIPSFFVAHVYHWGDVHIENVGYERASVISPANTAEKLGLAYTFHQDSPVIRSDMLETLWCAACRLTKSGVLLGKEERVSVLEALRAVTVHAAHQYSEENEKGSLSAGKRADFVILDKDPLKTPTDELKRIRVLETVKNGNTVYSA